MNIWSTTRLKTHLKNWLYSFFHEPQGWTKVKYTSGFTGYTGYTRTIVRHKIELQLRAVCVVNGSLLTNGSVVLSSQDAFYTINLDSLGNGTAIVLEGLYSATGYSSANGGGSILIPTFTMIVGWVPTKEKEQK